MAKRGLLGDPGGTIMLPLDNCALLWLTSRLWAGREP